MTSPKHRIKPLIKPPATASFRMSFAKCITINYQRFIDAGLRTLTGPALNIGFTFMSYVSFGINQKMQKHTELLKPVSVHGPDSVKE